MTMLAIVATLGLALTSCEDEDIAYTLEGTWEGNTYMYSYYNNAYYQSTYSYVDFSRDPFTYTSGTGHWIDYYSNAPWDYVANHIYWQVDNGVISIHFEEDNYTISIERYRLDDNHFTGTIYWDRDNDRNFDLVHTSSPNWNSYTWGTGWNYYYAPAAKGDKVKARGNAERPQRVFNPQNIDPARVVK